MNVELLDTTLRDGGLGLEDSNLNKISDAHYEESQVDGLINNLTESNVEIIELGSIQITPDDRSRFCIYKDIESISKKIPFNKKKNQKFAALYRGPDTPVEDIPNWNPSLCDSIRVIIRYSELFKSLEFCKALSKKGYKVFIQPMLTMRYTEAELDTLIKYANDINAYALYFVDSYGYMDSVDVQRFYDKFNFGLKPSIKIGFHPHNNMGLAFSNAKYFLSIAKERSVIIDSCIIGMGQGAGNLQTEVISNYLIDYANKKYDFPYILDCCDIIEKICGEGLWGYSVSRFLPAVYHSAYKYSVAFRHKYHLSYRDINSIFQTIGEVFRHRYTPENAELLYKNYLKENE